LEEPKQEEEEKDLLVFLLRKVIDTIFIEEVTQIGTEMDKYRRVLCQEILKVGEQYDAVGNTVKLDKLVHAFRAG